MFVQVMACESDKIQSETVSYFVVKSFNKKGLEKSVKESIWACSERKLSPQPKDVLASAFLKGDVILLFSVNNCHGWHGYANMIAPPNEQAELLDLVGECNKEESTTEVHKEWHKFPVQWQKCLLVLHQEKCLPFDCTLDLFCLDGLTPINKARNYQEISPEDGQKMCSLIAQKYTQMFQELKAKELSKQLKESECFLKVPIDLKNCANSESLHNKVWDLTLAQVASQLGRVIVACAFGSQRYNCHTVDSDMDMFIVYQVETSNLLGFNPHQQTIKNKEGESFDYTIVELNRFCELLLAGDPRCVETLFLNKESIYYETSVWQELSNLKHDFKSRQVCEKYVHDAAGAKGIRLLDKWVKSGDTAHDLLPKKVGKLCYIIIRLLQNALHLLKESTVHVYRDVDSDERQMLMQARSCALPYTSLRHHIDQLLIEVKSLIESKLWPETDPEEVKLKLERWLIQLRFRNLEQYIKLTNNELP